MSAIDKVREFANEKIDEITSTIANRRAICENCEHRVLNTDTPVEFYQCSDCGCPIVSKTAAPLTSCPKGKW
jgi:DNA-directed RNA polymerase subunit RPC12/RpoP